MERPADLARRGMSSRHETSASDGDRDGKACHAMSSFGHGGGCQQSAGSSAQVVQIHASHLGGLSQP